MEPARPTLPLDRSRQGRQCALHATGQIRSPFEVDTPDQNRDGDFLAALDLRHTRSGTFSALEAVELRCVLFDVLGHQQHSPVLIDEPGVARTHQARDDRLETRGADAPEQQRDQQIAADRATASMDRDLPVTPCRWHEDVIRRWRVGTEERGMRRDVERQRDFAEAFLPPDVGREPVLERVDGLVDRGALEAVCEDVHAAPVGRPSDPLIVLVKALLIRASWNLSDPKAEEALERPAVPPLPRRRAHGEDAGPEYPVAV